MLAKKREMEATELAKLHARRMHEMATQRAKTEAARERLGSRSPRAPSSF